MSISITDLLNLPNPNIIDIRSIENFNNNHIPNARNITSNELLLRPQKYLNKNETYYLYCRHGISSNKLCQILRAQGYNTVSIEGGYEAWLLQK